MADVKIIDIDNEQWNIKDQDARDKIAILETEIEKLKTIEKWEYTIPTYGGNIIARRQGNIVSIIANKIGSNNKIMSNTGYINFAILPERFRPAEECFYMMRTSGSYITQYGGIVHRTGEINFWTYVDIDNGFFTLSYIVDLRKKE